MQETAYKISIIAKKHDYSRESYLRFMLKQISDYVIESVEVIAI